MLINGFSYVDDDLRKIIRALIIGLPYTASLTERELYVINLHLSKEYLDKINSRKLGISEFFSTRSSWRINGADELDIGAKDLLKGSLKHEDMRGYLTTIGLPIIALCTTDDKFIMNAHHSKIYAAASNEDEHVEDMEDLFK